MNIEDLFCLLLQLLGMTATIGIGDSKSIETAKEYIIGMCAKFGLESPPSESSKLFEISQATPDEGSSFVFFVVVGGFTCAPDSCRLDCYSIWHSC